MLRLKNPLGGNSEVSPYGDKNVIEGVQVDGVDLIPDATKKVNIKGKYEKPAGGIPKSDLSRDVQESLENADSAIQQHQDISGKVDKENGKGLSTNDFTNELKQKLEDIGADADVNIIEGVQVDGVDLVPNGNKKVNIDLSGKQNVLTFDNVPTQGSNNPVKSGGVFDAVNGVNTDLQQTKGRIAIIENKIPNHATDQNQLADKEFVNSSISTNTAHYISNNGVPFTSEQQLLAYAGEITNNDYAFVNGTDSLGNAFFDRYKASVSNNVVAWAKEWRINNTGFTAEQWAAITSGITAALVAQLMADHLILLQKQDILVSGTNIKTINNGSILGGGNLSLQKAWRKIIDKTLIAEEDDTPYIAFTKDADNNYFSLSQVKICIYSPADDSMTSATQDGYILLGTNTLGVQNYGKVVLKRINKANYAVIEGFAQEDFITYVNFVACYTEIARKDNIVTCFGENPMMYEKISRIALACNTPNGQAGFRAGTRIVIWGIDK